jgi:phage terminase large subunit GpA-like protein
MESVARQYENAKTPLQKQAFHNTALAEVYDAGTEVELSPSELHQRAELIAPPYAANISFITAGVDVQRRESRQAQARHVYRFRE